MSERKQKWLWDGVTQENTAGRKGTGWALRRKCTACTSLASPAAARRPLACIFQATSQCSPPLCPQLELPAHTWETMFQGMRAFCLCILQNASYTMLIGVKDTKRCFWKYSTINYLGWHGWNDTSILAPKLLRTCITYDETPRVRYWGQKGGPHLFHYIFLRGGLHLWTFHKSPVLSKAIVNTSRLAWTMDLAKVGKYLPGWTLVTMISGMWLLIPSSG